MKGGLVPGAVVGAAIAIAVASKVFPRSPIIQRSLLEEDVPRDMLSSIPEGEAPREMVSGSSPPVYSAHAVEYESAEQPCKDKMAECAAWAHLGECKKNPGFMRVSCAASCNASTCASHDAGAEGFLCEDKHASCAFWAQAKECDKNPQYMSLNCAKSCGTCDLLDYKKRCSFNASVPADIEAGDVTRAFERILSDPSLATLEPKVMSRDPWLIIFENFLTADEADAILGVARSDEDSHFAQSQGTAGMAEDGQLIPTLSSYRTSSTYWCDSKGANGCFDNPHIKLLRERTALVTGLPDSNSEYPQFLRYYEGQTYKLHNDSFRRT